MPHIQIYLNNPAKTSITLSFLSVASQPFPHPAIFCPSTHHPPRSSPTTAHHHHCEDVGMQTRVWTTHSHQPRHLSWPHHSPASSPSPTPATHHHRHEDVKRGRRTPTTLCIKTWSVLHGAPSHPPHALAVESKSCMSSANPASLLAIATEALLVAGRQCTADVNVIDVALPPDSPSSSAGEIRHWDAGRGEDELSMSASTPEAWSGGRLVVVGVAR
jgi:hypothetical protein